MLLSPGMCWFPTPPAILNPRPGKDFVNKILAIQHIALKRSGRVAYTMQTLSIFYRNTNNILFHFPCKVRERSKVRKFFAIYNFRKIEIKITVMILQPSSPGSSADYIKKLWLSFPWRALKHWNLEFILLNIAIKNITIYKNKIKVIPIVHTVWKILEEV